MRIKIKERYKQYWVIVDIPNSEMESTASLIIMPDVEIEYISKDIDSDVTIVTSHPFEVEGRILLKRMSKRICTDSVKR